MRFRRRITLAPGVRLNVSGSGLSLSVGPRGASMTFGPRGTFLNTGIPGTGLYSRQKIGGSSRSYRRDPEPADQIVNVKAALSLEEDGSWTVRDTEGNLLEPALRHALVTQNKTLLIDSLEQLCEQANSKTDGISQLHWAVPDPTKPPTFDRQPFPEPPPTKPQPPTLRAYSLLDRLFRSRREAVDSVNAAFRHGYEEALKTWKQEVARLAEAKVRHDHEQDRLHRLYTAGVLAEAEAIEEVLALRLQALTWPRETLVDFEVSDEGRTIGIDVDLPEIEDMPDKHFVVKKRDAEVEQSTLSATRVRQLYMAHVHSIGLRIVGEVFHGLPRTQCVVISAFSQRVDRGTGHVQDEYLYSARIQRDDWTYMNWGDPGAIDPVEAFSRFLLRRKMSKTGVFKPIEPFSPSADEPAD